MSQFKIEKITTLEQARKAMTDKFIEITWDCGSSASRKTTYKHMQELYTKFPELATWWDYNNTNTRYANKFSPAEQKKKNYYAVNNDLPKLKMPCADTSNLPESRGLYFLGMIGINPGGTKYYLVKIGSTENISKRIKQYGTYNPMLYIGGMIENYNGCLSDAETTCHEYLSEKAYAYAQNAREWYYVDEDTYYELCDTFADKEMFQAIAEGRD